MDKVHNLELMIHEEICTYEVCKLAKEKGFNVPTRTVKVEKVKGTEKEVWDEEECRYITQWEIRSLRIPTQSLLSRWLREEKGYYVYPFFDNESRRWTWVCRELTGDMWIQLLDFEERYFDTYELALEDALKYTLQNLV